MTAHRSTHVAIVVALVVATLVLVPGPAMAQVRVGPFGPGLPPQVAEAVDGAAQRAGDRPHLRGSAERLARSAVEAERRPLDWSVAGGLDRIWTGEWRGDATLSLSLDLIDPTRPRTVAELERSGATLVLERSFARRDAALDVLSTWLALWSTRQRLALLSPVDALVPRSPEEARRVEVWLDDLPALRLEASLLTDRLARAAGVEAIDPLDLGAWSRYLAGPAPIGCPARAPAVRVARAQARAHDRSLDAEARAVRRPSLTAHASVGLVVSDRPDVPLGTRVSMRLDIGAPASWPTTGSLSLRVDERDASLRLRIASDDGAVSDLAPWQRDELARAVSDAEHAAIERTDLDRLTLQIAHDRLARGSSASTEAARSALEAPSTVQEIEAILAWIAWTVRAVDARARLSIDCEGLPPR